MEILRGLVLRNRSFRRFYQEKSVKIGILRELVDLARLSPSASNLQPLKHVLSCESEKNAKIFPHLAWAGYLKDWKGPAEGERPAAYIIILGDTEISKDFGCDHGIAAQSILLGAVEKGLGGCMVGSVDKEGLRQTLQIDKRYEILLVIALGKAREKVKIENLKAKGDIKYWRDEKGDHHVPKRALDEIILD